MESEDTTNRKCSPYNATEDVFGKTIQVATAIQSGSSLLGMDLWAPF